MLNFVYKIMCASLLSSNLLCFDTLKTTSCSFIISCRCHQMNKSRLASMNVIVLAMVVAVVLASTLVYSEAITSMDLCEQLKSNERRVLAMGARGRTQDDAHFYILLEEGYMFKVPLANLRVDANKKITSLKIDRECIRTDTLFGVSRDIFTRKSRFFLISNHKGAFLGRMFFCEEHHETAFQLFDLNGARPIRDHPQEMILDYYASVIGNIGIDSNMTYAFGLKDNRLFVIYTFKIDYKGEIEKVESPLSNRYLMDFSDSTDIVTIFFHKDNEDAAYYYLLDANGHITVTKSESASVGISRRSITELSRATFKINMSSFVMCHPPSSPEETEDDTEASKSFKWWIFSVVLLIVITILVIALYCTHLTIEAAKAKRRGRRARNIMSFVDSEEEAQTFGEKLASFWQCLKENCNCSLFWSKKNKEEKEALESSLIGSPIVSSNASSSPTSSPSTFVKSIKKQITRMLEGKKSKQAKAAAKAKRPKV